MAAGDWDAVRKGLRLSAKLARSLRSLGAPSIRAPDSRATTAPGGGTGVLLEASISGTSVLHGSGTGVLPEASLHHLALHDLGATCPLMHSAWLWLGVAADPIIATVAEEATAKEMVPRGRAPRRESSGVEEAEAPPWEAGDGVGANGEAGGACGGRDDVGLVRHLSLRLGGVARQMVHSGVPEAGAHRLLLHLLTQLAGDSLSRGEWGGRSGRVSPEAEFSRPSLRGSNHRHSFWSRSISQALALC